MLKKPMDKKHRKSYMNAYHAMVDFFAEMDNFCKRRAATERIIKRQRFKKFNA